MTRNDRLSVALQSTDPAEPLRAVVLEFAAEGCSAADIAALLEKQLLELRGKQGHREVDEDAILDVLDGLAGWCQPDAPLMPDQQR